MTTVALLRQTYLNDILGRADGATLPWTDTHLNTLLSRALVGLWPDVGIKATGTVATDSSTDIYTIPGSIKRVSRIEFVQSVNGVSKATAKVTRWRYYPDADPPTKVVIDPLLPSANTLRFTGYKAYADTGADLAADLEHVVACRAAALAWGDLGGHLANSQRQQALDSGRVVDYQTAVGEAAFWEREYRVALGNSLHRLGYAPRAAAR